jgi:hypothetical protein
MAAVVKNASATRPDQSPPSNLRAGEAAPLRAIQPRNPRSGRVFVTDLRIGERESQRVVVRNVSRRGVGLKGTPTPVAGTRISLLLGPHGYVSGVVRWSLAPKFGVLLDEPIDPAAFRFETDSWAEVVPKADKDHVFDLFRPVTSTWRPGFHR